MRSFTPVDEIYINSPSSIAFVTVLGTLLWLFIAAAISGDVAARDRQTQIHPLMFTAPATKAEYLGGRFCAAFALNSLLLMAIPVGILISVSTPGIKQDLLGPFRATSYATAYCFISLPIAFVGTTFQFSFSTLTGRPIVSYLASFLVFFMSHFVGGTLANFMNEWKVANVIDLVGFFSIAKEVETWTTVEKNTRLIALEGTLLWNRLLWFGFATSLLAYTYFKFRLAHPASGSQRTKFAGPSSLVETPETTVEKKPISAAEESYVPQRQAIELQNNTITIKRIFAIAFTSFGSIARSRGGLTIVGFVALVTSVVGTQFMMHFDIPLVPTTALVTDFFTHPLDNLKTPWIIIPLLTIFYTGELIWRERDARIHEIYDTSPVANWILLAGKFLGIAMIITCWLMLLMTSGIIIQVSMGYFHFEPALYFITFSLQLIDYLLFALLVLIIHAFVNQRYLGVLIALIAYGVIGFSGRLGIQHNLLRFAGDPGWTYTDMRGFGGTLWPWACFKLYWITWSFLFVMVAMLLWPRGKEQSLIARIRLAQLHVTRRLFVTTICATALLAVIASYIFYNTNVVNNYQYDATLARSLYERQYKQYENALQLSIAAMKLNVDIYPDRREANIDANYMLVNKTNASIDVAHFTPPAEVETGSMTFNKPATLAFNDDELSYRIYSLQNPLRPGDSIAVNFRIRYNSNGFLNEGLDNYVLEKATYFTNYDMLPFIGYQHYREISDKNLRSEYGLGDRPEVPSLYDMMARRRSARHDRLEFEAVVSTSFDQVAVAPGELQRTWIENGRRYFHYKTSQAISNNSSFFSGDYLSRQAQWKSSDGQTVKLNVYYHPFHAWKVEEMLNSLRASLDYYTATFGPYPWNHLTLIERPGAAGELNGEPTMIDYGEMFSLMNPQSNGLNLPYYVIAHEVAHQWWGAQFPAASVEGAGVLIEGLAVFSGMQVLEKNQGYEQLRRYLSFLRKSYEVPRTRAANPLLRANNSFLGYRKGPIALYALSQYSSRDSVNLALRRLIEKYRSPERPPATILDLYDEIQRVTPDSLDYLLHDLFETNTYWDLQMKQAEAKQSPSGSWVVTLDISARKYIVDSTGVEHDVHMSDWIEVGVNAPRADNDPRRELYLKKHKVKSGKQTITVTVPEKPGRAGIDPNYLLIDLDLDNNTLGVQTR